MDVLPESGASLRLHVVRPTEVDAGVPVAGGILNDQSGAVRVPPLISLNVVAVFAPKQSQSDRSMTDATAETGN